MSRQRPLRTALAPAGAAIDAGAEPQEPTRAVVAVPQDPLAVAKGIGLAVALGAMVWSAFGLILWAPW